MNYLESNPKKVVKFILREKKAEYGANIKKHRDIKSISGDEELVRGYLLTKLVNELGYKEENIEIEKEYPSGRPKTTKPRIDVILKDRNNKDIFLFIELKEIGEFEKKQDETIEMQLFNLAKQEDRRVKYLVLYSVEVLNDEIKDRCIIIDFEKYKSFDEWEKERNYTDELPRHYGKSAKKPYIKGSQKDLDANFSGEQLDSLRKELHNVLWGGGGTNYNDIFSSLVNLILAKIQDESEKNDGDKYDYQIFTYDKEDKKSFESNEEIFNRINGLYRRALKEKLNILDENKLKKSYVIDENKFSLNKLRYAVSKLESFSFVDGKNNLTGKDILGDFFEGIITVGFKQHKGQFFTHINIVKFLLYGLKLDELAIKKINNDKTIPYLIDPSAGSGTFLIEYMKFITKNIKYHLKDKISNNRDIQDKLDDWFYPDNRENKWAAKYIYGSEIDFDLGTAVKVNMILHGDGSSNIFVKDGLLPFNFYQKKTEPNILNKYEEDNLYFDKNVNKGFDAIITNPPFSVDLDKDTKKLLRHGFLFGDKKNSENLFIERWYQLLRDNGRMGVVLPESVFDTTENKYIRLFIYKYFKVKAVVSLPQLTFEPFTSTKTSLLFAQKKTKAEISEWNKLWSKYSNEWSGLKTRCENLLVVYLDGKDRKKLPSIKSLKETEEKIILARMLKDYFENDDKELSAKVLIEKYADELKGLCKYNNDTKDVFGFVNSWWVFGEVAKELNYKIFMAEVENIGYKRTKRGEKPMPNELYRTDDKGEVLVDDGVMKTALDYMRKIEWE
ncbi:N-6 DNA methylase [Candidatus Microgenomates bacterium]|nr:N-6 DNA methylase [Candidatus Microgenomates bacterium]